MKKSVFIYIILLSLIIPLASAEISFSQPNSVYNLGDDFSIILGVSSNVDTNSFLIVSLVCSDDDLNATNQNKIEIYRSATSVKAFEKNSSDISLKFDNSLINNLEGIIKNKEGTIIDELKKVINEYKIWTAYNQGS